MANDDTTIQAAIDSVFTNAGGGTVYLTRGDYNIHASIVMRDNINLVGEGNRTYFIPTGIGVEDVFDVSGASNYDIRDITVTGAGVINSPQTIAQIPGYIGIYPFASLPASANVNDIATAYSATQAERGIYVWSGFTWDKQAAPSVAMLSLAWPDICRATIAESAGGIAGGPYGDIADYIGSGVDVFAVIAAQAGFYNVLSAVSAFIQTLASSSVMAQYLAANTAFIDDLFANQITVPDGGRIRYETGSGVQKRTVQLADEKIDWLDTPDTTPATDELLVARIGRLGVGGAVLMDGDFEANITSEWSDAKIADLHAATGGTTSVIFVSDTEIRYAYSWDNGTTIDLYEKVSNGLTFGSEVLVSSNAKNPSYGRDVNGDLLLAYGVIGTASHVVLKRSGGAWVSHSTLLASDNAGGLRFIVHGGFLYACYRAASTADLEERSYSSGWSAASTVTADIEAAGGYILDANGNRKAFYIDQADGYVKSKTNTGTWGSEIDEIDVESYYADAIVDINGATRVTYLRVSDIQFVEDIYTGAWAGGLDTGLFGYYQYYTQSLNGNIYFAYVAAADRDAYLATLQRYARIGAGIIESGGTGAQDDAHYEKYSNGYARVWGRAWVSTSNASSASREFNITLPINLVADWWTLEGSLLDLINGNTFHMVRALPTAGSATLGTLRALQWNNTATTGYGYVNWHAEGLYE